MKPFIVGVTGSMGSGKTTFCRMLSNYGLPVFFADDQAKALYSNPDVVEKIKTAFGIKEVSLASIGKIVFSKRRNKFQDIMFPLVFERFNNWAIDKRVAVIESALLFESGLYKEVDFIIYITVSESERIIRLKNRGMKLLDIQRRLKYQYKASTVLKLFKSKRCCAKKFIYHNEDIDKMPKFVEDAVYAITQARIK